MNQAALTALARALGLGDDPARILEPLFALYAELETEIQLSCRGLDLPCHAGCDACCHEAVFLSAPEMLAVGAVLLEDFEVDARRAIVASMRAIAETFADELELLELLPAGEERDEVAARIKFRCPLLGAGGLCSVYRGRELNARTFGLTWDSLHGGPYGCELTHARLRVIDAPPLLFDAREARRRLSDRLPRTEHVRVFPWWFDRFGEFLT